MRKYINRKSLLVLVLALATFLYLTNNYNTMLIRSVDEGMLDWLLSNTKYMAVVFFEFITMLASWQAIVLVTLALLYFMRDKLLVLLTSGIAGFVFIINDALKNMFERVRPNVMHLTSASGYSMPSGHAIVGMVFYGLIVIFFISKIKDKKYRRLAQVLIGILIVLIGFSRIYLRVHFVSDVIAGLSLGLVILVVIYNLKVGVFDNITNYIEGEENE